MACKARKTVTVVPVEGVFFCHLEGCAWAEAKPASGFHGWPALSDLNKHIRDVHPGACKARQGGDSDFKGSEEDRTAHYKEKARERSQRYSAKQKQNSRVLDELQEYVFVVAVKQDFALLVMSLLPAYPD